MVVGVSSLCGRNYRGGRCPRTSELGIYATGDVTGVNLLASVAAIQGPHCDVYAFGDAVTPAELSRSSVATTS